MVEAVVDRTDTPSRRRPLRVGLVAGQLNIGGTERQIALLARGLQARGVEVHVAVLWEEGIVGRELRGAGVPVTRLGFPKRSAGLRFPIQFVAAVAQYVRWLRRVRPDVHHTFLPAAYLTVTPIARLVSEAVLVQARRSLRDQIRGFARPSTGLGSQARYHAVRLLDRLSVRVTDHYVANSDAVATESIRHERISWSEMTIIVNGVLPEFFRVPHLDRHQPEVVNIVCVANLHAYKGHADLLSVARRLMDDGHRFTVTLVGSGEERAALEHRANTEGLPVEFLGQRTDIIDVLRGADIVVHPSLSEGMSNSIIEAMAAGRPVVATDAGGTAEAIGDSGVVVPVGDTDALYAALRVLLHDEPERHRLGHLAQARARDLFSADTMATRHVALYETLAAERFEACVG